jgi:exonuclease SbcC
MTPRLSKINQSNNEIMSRHCAYCFAELEFETHKGIFRAYWSQRRARNKAGGKLQAYKHEISDAINGKVLESKASLVPELVREISGMDFEQFTRAILLAQGGFAAFLQASADERAPILEQITGTEIYTLISRKVHERSREECQEQDRIYENLQKELKSLEVEWEVLKGEIKSLSGERDYPSWLVELQGMRERRTLLESLELLINQKDDSLQKQDSLHQELMALEEKEHSLADEIPPC